MMNFFEIFALPTDFDIDQQKLDEQLRALQSQYHPDVVNAKKSEQMSAVINQAYQTLKFVDSRASHLLELVGQADSLQQSIRDLDFLDLAMDFRIELDESNSEQLPNLNQSLQDWLADIANQFAQSYQQQDWQTAIDYAQKLKFLVKIDKDLSKKVDELTNVADDDDLYV